MTHRALLTEVWGPAWSEDTATLRTHVANLRRKIEPADGERLIRTDPGVGYRIAALSGRPYAILMPGGRIPTRP